MITIPIWLFILQCLSTAFFIYSVVLAIREIEKEK